MKYIMNISQILFNKIVNGTKKIESRIYDEKRQKINIGDEIEFRLDNNIDITQKVKVIGLLRYASFKELFEDQVGLLGGKSVDFLLDEIYQFLSPERERKYGVVGIRIELV